MAIEERIRRIQGEVNDLVQQCRLLGEIELDDAQRRDYRELVRDLFNLGQDPMRIVPDVVALLMVEIARRKSDGIEFWPHVFEELVPRDRSQAGPDSQLQPKLGRALEETLRRRHLPTFEHLVEAGARRYLAPILGHALMPERLIPAYLDRVIRPALNAGWDADEVQERLAAYPPAGLPLAVGRFVIHGGDVARDLIGRTLSYTAAKLNGQPDSGDGLPKWLQVEIDSWCTDSAERHARPEAIQRTRGERPALRWDYGSNEIMLELPYIDGGQDLHWEVTGPPGFPPVRLPAFEPLWARSARRRPVPIVEPLTVLRVSLLDTAGAVRDTRLMPTISVERPALFFHPATGRALTPGEFLDGDRWYVLHHASATLGPPRSVVVEERLGAPVGWSGFEVSGVHVTGGQSFTMELDGKPVTWRLRAEEPKARFESSEDIPPYLRPVDADILAFEGRIPTVRVPNRPGATTADERYVRGWQIVARGHGHPPVARSAAELGATFDGIEWKVPLEDLIPEEDVGTWGVEVRGPSRQVAAARLALLPADFRVLAVPEEPAFVGEEREVLVDTPGGLQVLEHGDLASREEGHWVLVDHNRNGRIPFVIRDPRSGREATAALVLPTVEWECSLGGADGRTANEPAEWTLKEFVEGNPTLRFRSSVPVVGEVRCSAAGETLHVVQLESGRPSRSALVSLRQLSTTVRDSRAPMVELTLHVRQSRGAPWRSRRIAMIVCPATITDMRRERSRDSLVFTWRQGVVYRRMIARLSFRWRPWVEPLEAQVEQGAISSARFDLDSEFTGAVDLELRALDDWVGEISVHREHHEIGGAQPASAPLPVPTPERTIERALALADFSAVKDELAGMARRLAHDVDETRRVVRMVASIVAAGCQPQVVEVAWTPLGNVLASADFAIAEFVQGVAEAPPGSRVSPFLLSLAVPRWRALWVHREEVDEQTRARLWSRWPVLAAFFDLNVSEDGGARRSHDNLGPLAVDFGFQQDYWEIAGQFARGAFSTSQLVLQDWHRSVRSIPEPPFSVSGFARACIADLEQLRASPDRVAGAEAFIAAHELALTRRAEVITKEAPGWDVLSMRCYPNIAGFELLPWASLTLAFWERLTARGETGHALAPGDRPDLAVQLAALIPNIFERDLCLAEAVLAQHARRPLQSSTRSN